MAVLSPPSSPDPSALSPPHSSCALCSLLCSLRSARAPSRLGRLSGIAAISSDDSVCTPASGAIKRCASGLRLPGSDVGLALV
eukprot:2262603-Rhodomonas_salina.1